MIPKSLVLSKQRHDRTCGAATAAMVLNAFDIEVSEEELCETVFPDVRENGLSPHRLLEGLLAYIRRENLPLEVDFFWPYLSNYARFSRKQEYIVPFASGRALKDIQMQLADRRGGRVPYEDLFSTVERLMKQKLIRVYAFNLSRMQDAVRSWSDAGIPDVYLHAFDAFIANSHVLIMREGAIAHWYALDGTDLTYDAYHIVDPGDPPFHGPKASRQHFFNIRRSYARDRAYYLDENYGEFYIRVRVRESLPRRDRRRLIKNPWSRKI